MKSSMLKSAMLALFLFIGVSIASAATVTVGPTGQYASPCAAFANLQDGDTVQIDANGGTPYYDTGDCYIRNNNLTIVGVNGRPIIDGTNAGTAKALWVEDGHDVVIDNFEFRNTSANGGSTNAEAIRIEPGSTTNPGGGNVTIQRCYIHNNTEGILSDSAGPDVGNQWYSSSPYITFQYDEFADNGYGDGLTHNMYLGASGNMDFTLQYSWSHDAYIGNVVKTRGPINNILYNLIDDQTGTSSYLLDFPLGGSTYIVGNVLYKTAVTNSNANENMIMWRDIYDEGSGSDAGYDTSHQDLHVINNTVIDAAAQAGFSNFFNEECTDSTVSACGTPQYGPPLTVPGVFENNIFLGEAAQVTNDTRAILENNVVYANTAVTSSSLAVLDFANPAALDFHLLSGSPAIGAGIYPPTNNAGIADPQALAVYEYVNPVGMVARPTPTGSTMDAGAYSYPRVGTSPTLNLTYTQTITAPNTGTITVTGLPTPPAGQYNVVSFVSQNTAAIPNPFSVTSSTGTATATFQAYSVAATTVVPIYVYADGAIVTANITVNPGPTALQSITLDSVYDAATTVHLLGPGATPVVVDLTSSDPSILYIPPTVTIPAGQLSAETGSLSGGLNPPAISPSAPVTVTATYNGNSVQLTKPIFSTGLHNVYCAPCTVVGGQSTGLGIILAGSGIYGGSTVQFTSSNPAVIPNASSTIPAGQCCGNVTLPTNAVTASTNVTVTASYNGQTWGNTFTVTPSAAGTAASVAVVSGSGQSAAVGTSFTNPLVVLVEDASSNPVSGATVTFAGTGVSFPSGATAVTNSSGDAQVTAQPTSSGTLTITASVSGVSTPAMFTETGTSGGGGNILTVGPTGEYATPCEAVRAASAGDTIEIDYNNGIPYKEPYDPNDDPNGDHRSDCVWYTNNLTIVGVNGRPILDATGEVIEKAILNPRGANEVISNLELRNATNGNNAAGIRIDSGSTNAPAGGNITVENCYIHDNEDGVLTANVGPGSASEGYVDPVNDGAYLSPNPYITFEYDEFSHNGVNGSGSTHNMYIGEDSAGTTTFTMEYSWSHDAYIGHTVKTRAPINNILYNLITDQQGATSYLLDLPLGGSTYIVGNTLYKAQTTNPNANRGFMLWRDVADNGVGDPEYGLPQEDLHFVSNTVILDPTNNTPAYVVVSCQNSDASTCAAPSYGPVLSVNAVVENNIFVGPTSEVTNQSTAVASNNLIEANTAANLAALFVDPAHYNYHLVTGAAAIGAGLYPPTDNTGATDPKALAAYEYVQPMGAVARPTPTGSSMDEGAYSYPRADTPPSPSLSYSTSVTTPATGTITISGLPTPPSGQYNEASFVSGNTAVIPAISPASSATGTITATFSACCATSTTQVPIDIYVDGAYLTANVTVVPGAVDLQSITLDSTYYPETTVHLTNGSTSPVTIDLSTSDPSILAVPSSVTVPAGSLSAETGSETGSLWGQTPSTKTATISATYGGNTKMLPVTVYAPFVNHFYCNVYDPGCDIVGGNTVDFVVGIAGDMPAGGGPVTFTSDTPSVIPNQTFQSPAGNFYKDFYLTTNQVSTSTNVTLTIEVNGSTKSPAQVVTVTPASGTNVVVDGGQSQSATVGTNFPNPLVVYVSNGGTAASGVTVTFAGTGVSFPSGATAVTNSSGMAQVTAQPTTIGALTITATVSGGSGPATFTETGTARAPASVAVVSGSGQSAAVGANFASPLVVVVKDSGGNAVSGTTVTFTGTNVSFPSGATAVTGSNGEASVTAQPTQSGALTITASVAGVGTPADFSETGTASVALASITLDSIYQPGTTVHLTAPAPAGGAMVTLSSSDSSILYAPPTVTVPAGATSAETGTLLGSLWGQTPSSKTATLTASYGGSTKTLTNAFPTSQVHSFGCGSCTVKGGDAIGGMVFETAYSPVPYGGVTVQLTSSNPAVIPNGQSFSMAAGQGGDYLISLNTNPVSTTTTVSVTGTYNGIPIGYTITVTPQSPPTSIAAVSGGGQSANIGANFASPLVVLVENSSSQPVPGVTVTFAGTGVSFPSGATAVTNSSGEASVAAQPTATGALTISASVAGVSTPASFSETGTAGAPASVAVVSGSGQSAAVGTSFTSPLVVLVKDANNNPVSGTTVSFAGTGVSFPSGATAVTGSNGEASVTAQPTSIGALTIAASVAGVSTPASFSETGTAGAPASVAAVSGSGQSANIGANFASPLVVLVKDAYSNPVPGTTVSFAGTGVSFPSGATAVTGSNGEASVTAQPTQSGALTITASVAGVSTPADFSETGNSPVALASVTLDSIYEAGTTVHLTAPAPAGGAVVTLSSSDSSILYAPPTVTVPAGATSAETGTLLGSLWGQTPSSKTATLTASYGGSTKTLTNAFPTSQVHSFGCGSCTVKGGDAIGGMVFETAYSPVPYGGVTVQLTSSNPAVIPNGQSFSMAAGQGGDYLISLNTNPVSTTTTVSVTGTYNGIPIGFTITVTP